MIFDKVISICSRKDLEVWRVASPQIIEKLKGKKYIVIVPQSEISLFQNASPSQYEVVDENKYTKNFLHRFEIHEKISKSTIGWYIQQFLKLSALSEIDEDEIALIWDADTVPLKNIEFEKDGKIVFLQR